MDTVTNKNKHNLAVIVDYHFYGSCERVRNMVLDLHNKNKHTQFVLLVGNANEPELPEEVKSFFDVVIRNNKPKNVFDALTFKTSAMAALQEMSTLIPVVAFDPWNAVCAMYEDAGVLITYGEELYV